MPEETHPTFSDEVKKLNILVAEKNPKLQKAILTSLQKAGATKIQVTENGADAWGLWKNGKKIQVKHLKIMLLAQ